MANKLYTAKGVQPASLAEALASWLEPQGYETQTLDSPGGVTLQARQTSSWVQRQGVALTVQMAAQGETLQVEVGTTKWAVQAVSGVAAAIIFWPLLAIPAFVAYKQKQIIDETWRFVDRYMASGGQMGSPVAAAPAAPVAESALTVACPSCGATQAAGAKFCSECGAKMQLACPSCGAEVAPGAKFCESCGATLIQE